MGEGRPIFPKCGDCMGWFPSGEGMGIEGFQWGGFGLMDFPLWNKPKFFLNSNERRE